MRKTLARKDKMVVMFHLMRALWLDEETLRRRLDKVRAREVSRKVEGILTTYFAEIVYDSAFVGWKAAAENVVRRAVRQYGITEEVEYLLLEW